MLKNKNYLKGLGTGFIVGAILLQLMLTFQGTVKQSGKEKGAAPALDAATIKEQAPSYGLQVHDIKEKLYTQAQLDDAVQQGVQAANAANAEKAEKAAKGTPAPDQNQRTVYIYEGMNAAKVVDYLYKSGIVVDRLAFQAKLREHGLNTKIKSGIYTFPLGANVDQIIQAITEA